MCVCVSVPHKDVWILAASLPKWDTQNSSSGLASRTQSTVNYHVSVCVCLVLRFVHVHLCVGLCVQYIPMIAHGSVCVH